MVGKYLLALGCAAGVFALDQWTKLLVVNSFPLNSTRPVIPGFFDLVNIRNRGAAFGFLNRSDTEWQIWFFVAVTALATGVIGLVLYRTRNQPWLCAGLGLILGGATGNLVDRLRYHSVVDFLDFYAGSFHWPAFNVADIGICAGAGLVCLSLWTKDKGAKRA